MTKKERKARLIAIASMHLSKEGQKVLDDCAKHGDVKRFLDYLLERNDKEMAERKKYNAAQHF